MKKLYQLSSCSLFVFLFLLPKVHFAQLPPDLGAASSFALFTSVGAFNNIGAVTLVTGDIGTNTMPLTGFPPGTVIGTPHVGDATTLQAATDLGPAYSYLSNLPCDGNVLITPFGSVMGQTLTPGVYCVGSAASLNGNLILDAQGDPDALFIFQIGGALSIANYSSVTLTNGANLCNVYWQVNGAFALGDYSVFRGTVIANGAISLLEGSTLLGRGLSIAGAISLHNNLVTICNECPAPSTVIITETSVAVCGATAATFNYIVENGPTTTFSSNGTGTLSLLSLPNSTSTFTYTPSAAEATAGAVVTITATIADPDGAGSCLEASDNATVTISAPVSAGTGSSTTICNNSTTTINLASLLTGADADGTWTLQSGTPGGNFNAGAGTLNPNGLAAGIYTFRYTVTGTAPCSNDFEDVTVNLNASPDLAVIAIQSNICPDATFDLANLTITDNNNTTGTLSYYALQADAMTGINPLVSNIVAADGTFWIRKQTAEGCFDVASVVIDIVNPCAPCPNPNGETINGGIAPISVCRGEEFTLAIDNATSINLPIGGTIDWYYDSDPGFTPGIEGTLLGVSMITAGGLSIRNTCTDILAGEISFMSFQSNPDIFSFVVLADLAAGVAINFTDNGWLSSGSFRTGEGTIIWTVPVGGVTAGTIITIYGSPDNPFTASVGAVTTNTSLNLAAAGDQLISFCGTLAAPTKILSGIQFSGATWDADASDANSSALPIGLTNGVNAVAVADQANGRFNCNDGTTSGTASEIALIINTAANWTTSASILDPAVAPCMYNVTPSFTTNVSTLDVSIDDCGIFYIKGIVNPLLTNCTAEEGSTLALQVEVLCPEAILSGDITICQGQSAGVILTISGAPASQNVTGNITNGTVDVNFSGVTDIDGNAIIQINDITKAGSYQIENISIGAACPILETSGTATVRIVQPVTIVAQNPVVCSTRRLVLASLQASITPDGQSFTGVWYVLEADSDGTFRDAADVVNTTFGSAVSFVPGAADIARGYVTLILRSDDSDGPCAAGEASVRLTILRINCGEFPWNGQ